VKRQQPPRSGVNHIPYGEYDNNDQGYDHIEYFSGYDILFFAVFARR